MEQCKSDKRCKMIQNSGGLRIAGSTIAYKSSFGRVWSVYLQVTYLVNAHSTFLTLCRHFLMARKYIYIAAWEMTPLMELVRGSD